MLMSLWEQIGFAARSNDWRAWIVTLAVLVGGTAILTMARALAVKRCRQLSQRFKRDWCELLVELAGRTSWLFLAAMSLYVASAFVKLDESTRGALHHVMVLAVLAQAGSWTSSLLNFWISRQIRKRMSVDGAGATTLSAIGFGLRVMVWVVVLLLALENIGTNVTTLVAGLGIGGIAIALALQSVLSDLFASLSIVLDKPFVLGDFIIINDLQGTVEHIGLKTTRLRSLSGEQLVFSNSDLLGSRIRNFKRMYERRVLFRLGVTYDTPAQKLQAIGPMIRRIVESQPQTRFDRAHFSAYGDFSLTIEVVYFVLDPSYNIYMDIQQAVNLEIYRQFEQAGIEFAFPTSTVHLQHDAAKATASAAGLVSRHGDGTATRGDGATTTRI